MISILLPTRKRPELLRQSLHSLSDNADKEFEILLRVDDDDEIPEVDAKVIVGPRYGYKQLHLYVNELAQQASGEWLMLWNDDALMNSKGWTSIIEQQSGLKALNFTGELNLFPCISRQFYQALGHFSLSPHNDSWIEAISRVTGTEINIPLHIVHLRDLIDDETKQSSQAAYKTTTPEFHSPLMQALLQEDINKIVSSAGFVGTFHSENARTIRHNLPKRLAKRMLQSFAHLSRGRNSSSF